VKTGVALGLLTRGSPGFDLDRPAPRRARARPAVHVPRLQTLYDRYLLQWQGELRAPQALFMQVRWGSR
jgi:hypothetical protein